MNKLLILILPLISGCAFTFNSTKIEKLFDGKHHISCRKSCHGALDDPDREICGCKAKNDK